jgi:hypothetical protein
MSSSLSSSSFSPPSSSEAAHITLHSVDEKLHLARLSITESKLPNSAKKNPPRRLFIVDVSGSMGNSASEIVNSIIPRVLPGDEDINMMLFSSTQTYFECKSGALRLLKFQQGGTYMGDIPEKVVSFIQKYPTSQIVIITDGDVSDRQEVFTKATTLKYKIPLSASVQVLPLRFCNSSSANPDTKAVMSIGMMSTENVEPLDVKTTAEMKLFLTSFLAQSTFSTTLRAATPCLARFPGDAPQQELIVRNGDVFFVHATLSEINLSIGAGADNISVDWNELSSEDEIRPLLSIIQNRMRINAVMNQSSQPLFEFVDKLITFMRQKDVIVSDPNAKPSTRLRLKAIQQQLARSSKSLLFQMAEMRNQDIVAQFNSQQQASFLRGDDKSRAVRDLAKRQAKQSPDGDFTASIRQEICKLAKASIPVLSENAEADLTTSFYSTETLADVLRTLRDCDPDVLNQMSLENMLTLLGGTGLAFRSAVRTLADPWIFRMEEIYLDCFLSQSDLCAARVQAGVDTPILTPGTKKPITGVVPVYFSPADETLLGFYTRACPSLDRIHSSVAMMGLASDLPFSDLALQASALLALATQIQRSSCSSREFQFLKSLMHTVNHMTKTRGSGYFADLRANLTPTFFTGENNITGVLKPLLVWLENPSLELIPELVRLELRWRVKSRAKYLQVNDKNVDDNEKNPMVTKFLGIDEKNNTHAQAPFVPEPPGVTFYDEVDWASLMSQTSEWRCGFGNSPYEIFENLYQASKSVTVEEFRQSSPTVVSNENYDLRFELSYLIIDTFQTPKIVSDGKITPLLWRVPDIMNYLRDIVRNHHRSRYEIELRAKETQERISTRAWNLVALQQEAGSADEFLQLLKAGSFTPHDVDVLPILMADTCVNRQMKLWTFIVGRDFVNNDTILWNEGHMLRLSPKMLESLQGFFDAEHWAKLMDLKKRCRKHSYRQGNRNRHGFSNTCPSYWALGFETIDEMKALLSGAEWTAYVQQCRAAGIKKTYLN